MARGRSFHLTRAIVWGLVAPFFLLSAVTNGLMPQTTPDGITVIICSGDGPLELRIDPRTGVPIDDRSSEREEPCDWAAFNFNADLPSAPSAWQLAALVPAATGFFSCALLEAAQATGLPPSTGPPAVI